ncbi:MarR family transcriptional regulator [Flavobacteriaceae bacterium]|nr:MarR family transcriptional regulator [Flavobacteriaceae bacterium]MDB3862854.1 MarR family transcriptional regulator [Flavobacteriaceae bacterium]
MDSKKVIITLIKINSEINNQMMLELKPFGISIQQFNVLRILRGQKGVAANLSTVQERMINKMSNTTRLVDKLIEKSLVERIICKENRRKIELFITEEGLSFLNQIDPVIDRVEEKMVGHLKNTDKEQLVSILKQFKFN